MFKCVIKKSFDDIKSMFIMWLWKREKMQLVFVSPLKPLFPAAEKNVCKGDLKPRLSPKEPTKIESDPAPPRPLPPHSHRPIWGATGPNGCLGWGQKYQAWTRPVRQYCARCARWAWKQQNLPKQCVQIYYTLLCNNVFCSMFVYLNWDKVQLNVSQERTLGGDLFLAPNHQRSGHVCHIC